MPGRAWAVLATLASGSPAVAADWQRASDDEGIVVWTREVEGQPMLQVKGEAVVAVPIERLWAVLVATSKFPEFMPNVASVQNVGSHSRGTYEYFVTDPPIVSLRDSTVVVTLEVDEETGVRRRSWTVARDRGPPPNDAAVRMQLNDGSWTLAPRGDGRTDVTYFLHFDPGGSIPAWMANRATVSMVPDVIRAVVRRAGG